MDGQCHVGDEIHPPRGSRGRKRGPATFRRGGGKIRRGPGKFRRVTREILTWHATSAEAWVFSVPPHVFVDVSQDITVFQETFVDVSRDITVFQETFVHRRGRARA
jgi:hypothetical protein